MVIAGGNEILVIFIEAYMGYWIFVGGVQDDYDFKGFGVPHEYLVVLSSREETIFVWGIRQAGHSAAMAKTKALFTNKKL